MIELIGVLGWLTAISYGIALLNFFLKYINKKYILNSPKEHKNIVKLYKKVMMVIVKNHKVIGVLFLCFLTTHFFIAFSYNRISMTGIIAAILITIVCILGIYVSINKNYKGFSLKIHRILAFVSIIVIAIHLI